MILSPKDAKLFYGNARFFSTTKLHDLDEYWSNNSTHPIHQQIHEMIESILIQRGELTLKQEKLNIIRTLNRSFLISNPAGRFSANIITLITKILVSIKFIKIKE